MAALASPQLWAWIAIAVASGLLVWLLSPILAPFLFGAILAYIFAPIVEKLTRRRVPRTLAVVLVLLLALLAFVALILVVMPLIYKESRLLMERIPDLFDWLDRSAAPWLKEKFDFDARFDVETLKQMARDALAGNEDVAKRVLRSLGIGGLAVLGFLANLVLIPVVLFYLLRDWNVLIASLDRLIPRRIHARAETIAKEVDAVLAEWLRGQLLVILLMSVYYCTALSIARLDSALAIGIITGIAVIVPYIGIVVGVFLATATALLQFDNLANVLWVWLAIGVGQVLEGMLVTPLIVGQRIGLHPVAVIFALLAFGQLFGFVGVLLALPASAALLVGLRHVRAAYMAGPLYGNER
jgi:predicted PurR-regulated permease PerM